MKFVCWCLAFSVLLVAPAWSAEDAPSVKDQIAAIQKEYQDAMEAFGKAYQKAGSDEERQKLFETSYPKPESYAPRLMNVVMENEDDPAVVDALSWIVQNVRQGREKKVATKMLIEDHIESDALGRVAASMIYSQDRDAEAHLRKIHEQSPHRNVKGMACYSLAEYMSQHQRVDEATKLYETVVASYSDVPGVYGGTLGKSAEGALFEMRNLSVGKPAPNIEGEDVDGVAFNLSDYRGKVVFLDFWGDW